MISERLLAVGSARDICTELQLVENEDGLFINADGSLILFPVGAFLPWQKRSTAMRLTWRGGAPVAFSYSADGHDAAALHLGPESAHHQTRMHELDPEIWHTAEGLGNWSLVQCDGAPTIVEKAAPDWFPTPRTGAE